MGEGQWELADDQLPGLNELDSDLESAVSSNDDGAFKSALAVLLAAVRRAGSPLPADELVDSDLILPPADASVEEVRQLLGDEGLIPG
jgi:hypothetical protein